MMKTGGKESEQTPKTDATSTKPTPTNHNDGEPFIDPEELADPRLRWMREKCAIQSSGWGKIPHSTIPNVMSVGEVIKEHPILKPLLQ
jgi:hypothetical protein